MLNITLPDGNKLNFEKKVTGLEIAEKSVSHSQKMLY